VSRAMLVACAAAALAGCAGFSPDGGMDRVAQLTRERTGQVPRLQRSPADAEAAQARVAELLAQPLTPDAAVEVALLGNRGLQADLGELGIAEAELVQAGRLKNPSFGFGRLAGAGALEIDRSLMFGILDLLTLPAATGIARERFEQAQWRAAAQAVGLAAETRRAYFEAVAAQQLAGYGEQVVAAADASAELARRMAAAGNFSRLDQLHEQAFYADATARLARARQQALAQRERLARLLGIPGGEADFKLPERLPELPQDLVDARGAEQLAMDKRLDVQIARRETAAIAKSLGLANATRFVNALELGWQDKRQAASPDEQGVQVQVEVPLFDFGAARSARAEALYRQSVERTAQVALEARSDVRESYAAYRSAHDLARHYRDEIVPLRKRIADENLLRYNGMLIGVFELIADAREQVSGVTGHVEALRDFWIADTQLQAALAGCGSSPAARGTP
jgi:outer membrane protein TolC